MNIKVLKENKWILSLFAFAICITACFMLTNTFSTVSAAANSQGTTDYSLASISEQATLYVNTMSSPEMHGCKDLAGLGNQAGIAGGMIGFQDTDNTTRNYYLCSRDSSNVTVWSYDKLGDIPTAISEGGSASGMGNTQNAFVGYAAYGYALSELGLDEVGTGADSTSLRMIVGVAMMALYVLAVGMSTFFNLVVAILQWANPFRMFSESSALHGWISSYSDGATSSLGIGSAIATIVSEISKLYDLLHNISLFLLIPMFLAIAFFMWLIVNKGQRFTSIFKPFAIRLFFVILGVPLMFGVYSVILDAIQGSISATNSPATTVVGSLFCDFDAWAESKNNIALPNRYIGSLKVNADTMDVDSVTMANVRNICYAINAESYDNTFKATLTDGADGMTAYANYDTTITSEENKPTYKIGKDPVMNTAKDAKTIGTALSILQKYARGDKLSAAAYESAVAKSKFTANPKQTLILFTSSKTYEDFDSELCTTATSSGNDGASGGTLGSSGINANITADDLSNIAASRWVSGSDLYSNVDIFTGNGFDGGKAGLSASGVGGNRWRNNDDISFSCSGAALSPLSLYNYLNTKFTSTEIRVSSPTATSNDQIKYQHYAVSMVGNSFMRFIYLMDALILLSCISIIGYGYGFAMLIANFKGLFKLIPNVLTGMLGSIGGIASSFALMFAMICEVVGTILMFDVSIEIIFMMYKIVELPLQNLFTNSNLFSGLDNTVGGNVTTGLLGVISCVVILAVTKQLLVWRTAIVGAASAACTNFVNKMLNTGVSAPNIDNGASNILTKAGTAVAAGASIAYGASKGLYGQGAKDYMDNLKNKYGNSDTEKAIKDKFLSNKFGAKSGNGTAGIDANAASALTSSDAKIAQDEQNKIASDPERAGSGLTDGDTAAEAYASNHSGEFESSLASGTATDDSYGEYLDESSDASSAKDGTTTSTKNGITTTTSRVTNGDGSVTTTTSKLNGHNGKSSKKAVTTNGSMQYTDTTDANGNTSHETLDTRTGDKTVSREVNASGGKKLVQETYHTNDDGSSEVITKTNNADGTSSNETTVTAASGDKTVNRETVSKSGSTYVNESVHKDSDSGNTITTTTTSGSGSGLRGGHSVSMSTVDSTGNIVNESATTYSSSGQIVNKDVTDVVRTDNQVIETHTKTSGGVTNVVKTVTNGDSGSMTKTYTTTGNSGISTSRSESFTRQSDGSYTQNTQSNVINTTTYERPSDTVVNNTVVRSDNTQYNNNIVTNHTASVSTNMFDSGSPAPALFTNSSGSVPSIGASKPAGRDVGHLTGH